VDRVLLNNDKNNISRTIFWSSSVLEFISLASIQAVRWNAHNVNHLQVRCACVSGQHLSIRKSSSAACMSGLESIGKESHGKMDTSFSMGTISQECIILCTPGKPYKKTQQFLAHFYQKCYDNHRRTKPHQYYFEQLQFQDQRGLDYLIWCMD
jgi:hypothetical protein